MAAASALESGEWAAGILAFVIPILVAAAVAFIHRRHIPKPLLFVAMAAAIIIGAQTLFVVVVIPLALFLATSSIYGIAHFELQLTPPFSWVVRAILWNYWSLAALVLLPVMGLLWSIWLSLALGKRWSRIVPVVSPSHLGK